MSYNDEKLQAALNRIGAAEKCAGRKSDSVTLIAVSKTKSVESVLSVVKSAAAVGLKDVHFGENYVQEAVKKIEKVNQQAQALDLNIKIHWHLIGALQTNKSKSVVGKFETIQSIDRIELAKALDARAIEAGVIQNIFVQVKLGDEPTKNGISAALLPGLIKEISALKNLRLQGLMSLPPIEAEAEASRKYFVQLRELAQRSMLNHLSMGTSHDFEVAIEEGATMVRVGTAIFGAREMGGEN